MDTTITVNEHSIEYIYHALQFTLDTIKTWAEHEMNNKNFDEAEDTFNKWQSYLWAFEDISLCKTGREKDYARQEQLLAVYKDRLEQSKARYNFLTR